jgi:hypothetical protein
MLVAIVADGYRLYRANDIGHPNPSYHVAVAGEVVGRVTRFAERRRKTGRWVNQGTTLDTYWQAEPNGTGASITCLTRRDAVATVIARHTSQDARP